MLSKEALDISRKIQEQGDIVRKLKGDKMPKVYFIFIQILFYFLRRGLYFAYIRLNTLKNSEFFKWEIIIIVMYTD